MKKLLIIEDDMASMYLYDEVLKQKGYEIKKCFNGKQALKQVEDEKPDLIILDLRMPLISGNEVFARLKSCHRTKDIPIIVGTADKTIRKEQFPGADVIHKPIDIELLTSLVEKHKCLTT
jgi:CheY-like chemotaxis protein